MIKLCEYRKIQAGAIDIDLALHIVELLQRAPRVVQPDECFRQHRSMKKERKWILVEDSVVDPLAKLASAEKIHRLHMKPGEGQAAQRAGGLIRIPFCQRQGFSSFVLQ